MRRSVLSVVLAGVALTGCSNFRDLFSAHSDVAAEAGAVQLPAQRLADMMAGVTKGQRQRVTRETADFITDTWVDYAVRIFSIAGLATPSFWLGIVFILVMLIVFKWLPPMVYTPFWVNPWQNMLQLIWPALAVGYRYSAVATRMTRSAMLEVLREDYIRTARAKGLIQKLILSRHALKNAMLPVVTVIGLEFAFLLGGLVVTEQVFNLNGLGLLFVQAVAHRDYTLIQALVMLVAGFFIVVNFAMDVMYAWLDPRIKYS